MDDTPIVHVVDDEPAVSLSIQRLLRSVGLEGRTYTSAQEFLRSKLPDAPGCLILDIRPARTERPRSSTGTCWVTR